MSHGLHGLHGKRSERGHSVACGGGESKSATAPHSLAMHCPPAGDVKPGVVATVYVTVTGVQSELVVVMLLQALQPRVSEHVAQLPSAAHGRHSVAASPEKVPTGHSAQRGARGAVRVRGKDTPEHLSDSQPTRYWDTDVCACCSIGNKCQLGNKCPFLHAK
jgi:hypothetical protein